MRLLRSCDDGHLELHEYLTDNVPPYAILSHTWLANEYEVSFDDLTKGTAPFKEAGFRKIQFCQDQATKDGLDYFWVDTCCIDKSSSAELQEAITSMFKWYRNAAKCYVFLVDVSVPVPDANDDDPLPRTHPDGHLRPEWERAFRASRWFTRGWTLQELLAPSTVEFFSVQGKRLGDKQSLEQCIHEITRIPIQALRGDDITKFTVEERLSWAAERQTKRIEDKAYSLLGILTIFMPLMYGEGPHASKRLQDEIEKIHGERHKLLSTLPHVPQAAFNSLENRHGSTCLPATRVELLRDIATWVDGPDKRCIFWLNGIAGTGKTTVARTIAQTYHDRGCLGASFFFSRGGGDLASAEKFFTTLACQLAMNIPQTRSAIYETIRGQENIATRSLRDQWDYLILQPLQRLEYGYSSTPTVVLVIDALNECRNEEDIQIIIRLLASSKSLNTCKLRIFITGRPDISVRCGFSRIPEHEHQTVILHDMSRLIVDRDLSLFFNHNFKVIRERRGFTNDWPGMEVIRRLVSLSCGLFIWASTACRFIRDGKQFSPRRISLLINRHWSGHGPDKQMDQIYITVLRDSIEDGYDDDEKQEMCKILQSFLGSIVILSSPLTINSLSNLISLPVDDIHQTLADLHAIFDIPTQEDRPIRLHHPSFRDFILNKYRCSDLNFWVDEEEAHRNMASNCLRLMSRMLKRDICGLRHAGTVAKTVDPAVIRKFIPPELEYACLNWVLHHQKGGLGFKDGSQANKFLQTSFLYWLEAIILLGRCADVAIMLRLLASLIVPGKSLSLFRFVHDVRRFFYTFQSVVEHRPLQLYCAALVFSPRRQSVRLQFHDEMRRWIRGLQMGEATNPDGTVKRKFGQPAFLNNVEFTPDGKHLVSGSSDPDIRLWDVETRAIRGKFVLGPKKPSYGAVRPDGMKVISISADGTTVASGSDEGIVTVWDWKSRKVRYSLRNHSTWVNGVAFSWDGKLLISGSMDESIRIWDMENGRELKVLANDSCVHSLALSPDGSLIAAASTDKLLRLWDTGKWQLHMLLDGHSGAVNHVRFSPDGKQVVSGSDDMTVKLWSLATGAELATFEGHIRRILSVSISPDAKLIASGSEDMTIKVWAAASGGLLYTLEGHSSGINSVNFSPNGRHLASSSVYVERNEVRLWDARTGESLGEFDQFEEDVVLLGDDDNIDLPDHGLGADMGSEEILGHSGAVLCIEVSPDDQLVATGSQDATIRLWTTEGESRDLLIGHTDTVNCLAFSPDSRLLASASLDKTAMLWDTETGEACHVLAGHDDKVGVLRFSPDGSFLATCSTDKTTIVWHVETGAMFKRLEGHSDTVNDVAFAPIHDGRLFMASGSADTTVMLWAMSTSSDESDAPVMLAQTLEGHSDVVNSVEFSYDGKVLVSCSADSTIRLWDVACVLVSDSAEDSATSLLAVLEGHAGPVNSAGFSPDGKLVVSCSDDETVRMWNVETFSIQRIVLGSGHGLVIRKVEFLDISGAEKNCLLRTDRGLLDVFTDDDHDTGIDEVVVSSFLDTPDTSRSMSAAGEGGRRICTTFVTQDWVRVRGEDVLCLPKDYYATSVASIPSTGSVVLGHSGGNISFVHF